MKDWRSGRLQMLLLTILCLLIFIGDGGEAMSLQVAPYRFVFRIDEANTQVAMVTNTADHALRIKIYPETVPGQNPEEYLGEWVVVYPRLLSLQPGERKLVRFSVRPPEGLKDGEYRTLLFFEELPQEREGDSDQDSPQLDLQFLTKLGINLYGQKGRITHIGQLQDVTLELVQKELNITGKFANLGNAHLLMSVRLLILDSSTQQILKEKLIPAYAVHRSAIEDFTDKLEFVGSGSYTLKIIFKMEDVIIHEYNKTFEIRNTIN